jgi:glycerophosphoryl diester phosphodiesterase
VSFLDQREAAARSSRGSSMPTMRWAHERNVLVLAWTVSDRERLDQLLSLGAHGITTANLAVLRALSG